MMTTGTHNLIVYVMHNFYLRNLSSLFVSCAWAIFHSRPTHNDRTNCSRISSFEAIGKFIIWSERDKIISIEEHRQKYQGSNFEDNPKNKNETFTFQRLMRTCCSHCRYVYVCVCARKRCSCETANASAMGWNGNVFGILMSADNRNDINAFECDCDCSARSNKKRLQFVDWSVKFRWNDIAMGGVHCGNQNLQHRNSNCVLILQKISCQSTLQPLKLECTWVVIWPERFGFFLRSHSRWSGVLLYHTVFFGLDNMTLTYTSKKCTKMRWRWGLFSTSSDRNVPPFPNKSVVFRCNIVLYVCCLKFSTLKASNAHHEILWAKKRNIKAIRFTKNVPAIIYSLRCEDAKCSWHCRWCMKIAMTKLRTKQSSRHSDSTHSPATETSNRKSLNLKLDFLAFCTLVDLISLVLLLL